jgi:hypothetical protein
MFLAYIVILPTVLPDANAIRRKKMLQDNSSYRDYEVSEGVGLGSDRLPVGPALFTVFGLSLLGWAVVLAPLVAILHL